MTRSLGEKVVSLRWAIVAAWVLLAGALAVLVPSPGPGQNELQTFLPGEAPSLRASVALANSFPQSAGLAQAVIVIERGCAAAAASSPGRLTPADLEALNVLATQARQSLPRAFPEVRPASSLAVTAPGDFRMLGRANPLISPDGDAAIAVVQVPANFATVLTARVVARIRRAVEEAHFPDGVSVAVTGSAGFGADYATAAERSYRNTLWVTVLAVTVILLVVYRAPLAAGTMLATISLAAIVASYGLDLAVFAGLHVGTAERIFVFVLLYGVGVDYSLLYISRFRESLAGTPEAVQAAGQALSATGPTILTSSGTDIVGLAMLSAASFKIFQTTGNVVPLALLVGLAASLTLVPSAAAIAQRRLFWPGKQVGYFGSRSIWPALAKLVTGRPMVVLAVTVAVLAVPAARALHITFVYDTLTELGQRYGSVRGREMVQRHWPVGEITPTTVLLEAGSPSAADELPSLAQRLTGQLEKTEGVADVRSLSQPLGRRTGALTGIVLAAGSEKVRAEYLSAERRASRIEVILAAPGFSNAAMATLGRIEQATRAALPAGVEAYFAGATAGMADIRAVTSRDFYHVAALVLTVVFLIVLLLLRDPLLSGFMVASMVLSYLAAMGLTWWFFAGALGQEGLDWKVEVFLFVVMVAVGVDYNIFLASRLAEEARTHSVREAARVAIVKTGGIISSAGLIMAATLGSLVVGEIALLVQLGFAFAVGMLLDTFLVRPLLLPAFAVLTRRTGRIGGLPRRARPAVGTGQAARPAGGVDSSGREE